MPYFAQSPREILLSHGNSKQAQTSALHFWAMNALD